MKKSLLVLASSVLLVGAITGCSNSKSKTTSQGGQSTTSQGGQSTTSNVPEPTTKTIKFGFGYVTSFSSGKVTETVVAAAFENEKVVAARTDVKQVSLEVVEVEGAKKVAIKAGTTDGTKSKCELGTDYGMSSKPQGEVYKQIESWSKWAVGKTVTEIENNDDTIAGCSISTGDFEEAIKMASQKAYNVTVSIDATLKVGVGMGVSSLGSYLAEPVAGALTDGTNVITSYVDVLPYTFQVSTDGTAVELKSDKYSQNAEDGQVVKSKRDLGSLYGMGGKDKGDGTTTTEFNVHCESMDAYVTGKTLAQVAAMTDETEVAGCTASFEELLDATQEAVKYSVMDVITDKPQA